jgi:hypothetical protein
MAAGVITQSAACVHDRLREMTSYRRQQATLLGKSSSRKVTDEKKTARPMVVGVKSWLGHGTKL